MAKLPQFPLLRLDPPKTGGRATRQAGFPTSRKFSPSEQQNRPAGRALDRLSQAFAAGADPLQLRSDPSGLAPERLLVFELTTGIQNFARAAIKIPGLEFIGAEDIDGDEEDKTPALYLMIPDSSALHQLVTLWNDFKAGRPTAQDFAPLRNLFAQMRDLRPWGPQDRLTQEDLLFLEQERPDARGMIRIELELVFRGPEAHAEPDALKLLDAAGGALVARTRIDGAKYHALLIEVPQTELAAILSRGQTGLVAAESVMHIRPQSAVHITAFEAAAASPAASVPLPTGEPIVAVFDAVPLVGHPRLAGRLTGDDPFNLEPLAVGERVHGTAMASAVIHGDLGSPPLPALERRVQFVNVMFAPGPGQAEERFPDRLPADLFHEAVLRLKSGGDPQAASVIVINASLGDRNKPFAGRMSGWARVLDYLAHAHGLLFVVSAGNHYGDMSTLGMNTIEFEALDGSEKAKTALRASASQIARRRILAPAESVNAVTVGAFHKDSFSSGTLPASIFDVWENTGLCTVSSGLGPGLANSVKPDVLAPGGRHHVRVLPAGNGHHLRPVGKHSSLMGGIVVAAPAPPTAANPDFTSRTVGTSVAAAIMSGVAARAHEALEATYDDFLGIPGPLRAALLKSFIIHCARWTHARDLIVEILGPSDNKKHTQQKDNVRRYLGYGCRS